MEYKYIQAALAIKSRVEFFKHQAPRKLYTQEKLNKLAKNYK